MVHASPEVKFLMCQAFSFSSCVFKNQSILPYQRTQTLGLEKGNYFKDDMLNATLFKDLELVLEL
jgi:hypothetical protein